MDRPSDRSDQTVSVLVRVCDRAIAMSDMQPPCTCCRLFLLLLSRCRVAEGATRASDYCLSDKQVKHTVGHEIHMMIHTFVVALQIRYVQEAIRE